jgi:hypothetical protein
MAVRPVQQLQRLAQIGWRPGCVRFPSAGVLDGKDARLSLQLAVAARAAGPGILGLDGSPAGYLSLAWRSLGLAAGATHGMPDVSLPTGWHGRVRGRAVLDEALAAGDDADLAMIRALSSITAPPRLCPHAGHDKMGWAAHPGSRANQHHRLAVQVLARSLFEHPLSLALSSRSALVRGSGGELELASASSQSIERARLLARVCASHGLEEEALVLLRWITLLRGGVPSVVDVEATATALGSLSALLPRPRPLAATLNSRVREELRSNPERSPMWGGSDLPVSEWGEMGAAQWPANVPVPSRASATRLEWAWALLHAGKRAVFEDSVLRHVGGLGEVERIVPGRLIASLVRVLVPTQVASRGRADGDAAWGLAMASDLVWAWMASVHPEVVALKQGAEEDSGEFDEVSTALAKAGVAVALEALCVAQLRSGNDEEALSLLALQTGIADRVPGELRDAVSPSSELYARLVESRSAGDEKSAALLVDSLLESGRRVSPSMLRALVTLAVKSRAGEEVMLLQVVDSIAAAVGQQVPAQLLGWCAFLAAQQGWWEQVVGIRRRCEKDYPGHWETSLWAGKLQTLTKAVQLRATMVEGGSA